MGIFRRYKSKCDQSGHTFATHDVKQPNKGVQMSDCKLLSIPEAAERIGVSRASLYRAVNNGLLPLVKIGGRSLVDPTDLTALVNASKRLVAA